jgi:hypothetical protein
MPRRGVANAYSLSYGARSESEMSPRRSKHSKAESGSPITSMALVVAMAASIQFYARWRRLRAERLANQEASSAAA